MSSSAASNAWPASPTRPRRLRSQLVLTTALALLISPGLGHRALAAGGSGGKGDYGHSAGTGGAFGVAGTAGGGAKTYQTQTGGGGGGGGANAAGGTGGLSGFGESGGTAGTAGAASGGAGGDGGNGTSGSGSAAGGGGGGGGGDGATGATYTNASGKTITGGKGGKGGNGGSSNAGSSQVTGGGGGGGAGGNGLTLTGTSATNAGTIVGGAGGAGGTGAFAGSGGDGGVGIYSSSGTAATIINSGTITGGKGGAAGTIATTGDYLAQGGSAGTTGAGGAGILGSNLTIVNTGTITGGYSGDGATQADAITFSGGTNSLTLSSGGTTGTLNGGIGITGSLAIDPGTASGASLTLSNVIHGTGSVEKTGAGTLVLTGTETYTGGTTITAGTLQIGANGTAGSIMGNVVDNATLAFDRSDTTTFSGVISGTGAVTQIGDGTTILTGTNTYTGGTTISAGTLQIGAGGTKGSITGDVVDNATLAFDRSDSYTFAGVISGSGAVSQIGSGTTSLTGTNTYTGQTTVSAGSLVVDGGAITQTQGITLDGNLTIENGGTVYAAGGYLGSGTVAGTSTLTITGTGSSLTLKNDLNLGLVSGSTTTVKVIDDGALSTSNGILGVASGSTANVTVDGSKSSWTLNHYLSVGDTGTGTLTISNGGTVKDADVYYDADASIGTSSGAVGTVIVTGSGSSLSTNDDTLYVGQSGTGTLQVANGGTATVASGSGTIVVAANNGSTGTLVIGAADGSDGSSTGAGTISAAGVNLATSGGSVVFNHDETGYTFATPIYGAGSVKVESGTTILTGTNTYTGGTTITGGTLQIGDGKTSGSITGDVANNGTLAFDRSDSVTFAGAISGTGAVTQAGIGTTILTGSNTYTGATTVASGTLQIGDGKTSGSITGDVADNGTLAFDRSDNVTFAGAISGTGKIAQIGSGTLTLSGMNTYSGGTKLSTGSIVVANNAALGTGTLAMAEGTTLAFASGTNYTIANAITLSGDPTFETPTGTTDTISGVIADSKVAGELEKTGGGTLVLTGADTYTGGTKILAGTLQIGNGGMSGSIVGNVVDNSRLVFDRSDTLTFAGAISGTGTVTQIGSGTTILTGTSIYTGATTVASGALYVNGSIASSSGVTVASGATLGGTGTVSSLTVLGTLAPGASAGSIGTLTVAGDVTFGSSSTYRVNVSPKTASSVSATGGATLAGTVDAIFTSGTYLSKRYTILTTANGISGAFGGLTTANLPSGFKTTLNYDSDNVYLNIYAALALKKSTGNQSAVTQGLNAYFNNGGTLPPTFVSLFQLRGSALSAALAQLSGEGVTAAQSVAHRSSGLFTSAIADQTTLFGQDANQVNAITLSDATPGLRAMQPVRELGDDPAILPTNRTWRAWGVGFGGTGAIHADSAVGTHGQNNTIYGGVLGVDNQLTPNLRFGIAVGGSDGAFSVPTLATSGTTTGGHVALYNLATLGSFYGSSSVAFSYFTNHTSRTALTSLERGRFDSHEIRTRLEAGRHFTRGGTSLTPFVALEVASLRSNGFHETTQSSSGAYALDVQGQTAASVPLSAGLRWQQKLALSSSLVFSPSLQVAYMHDFAPLRAQSASFAALPGSLFLVQGASPSPNSAQVKLAGELAFGGSAAFFVGFDSDLSSQAQFYSGKGGFKFVW